MKHLVLLTAWVIACKASAPPERAVPRVAAIDASVDTAPDAARVASCVDDGKPFDAETLKAEVAFLASDELDGRAPNTDGDRAARAHLALRMLCLGLVAAGTDGYAQPFEADGKPTANLVGYIAGKSKDIIVVGAHHDHLGDGHLGANDNASGTAAVLAIAQAIRQRGQPERTIAFVLFGGEELGLRGSEYFASHPPEALPLDQMVAYINIDMIGSHASKKVVAAFGAFLGMPSAKVLHGARKHFPKVKVAIGGHSVRGDQVAFCSRGIPYVFFWTPDERCYHETCDTVDNLDLPRMADIATLAGELVTGLSSTKTDLAAARRKTGCGR